MELNPYWKNLIHEDLFNKKIDISERGFPQPVIEVALPLIGMTIAKPPKVKLNNETFIWCKNKK